MEWLLAYVAINLAVVVFAAFYEETSSILDGLLLTMASAFGGVAMVLADIWVERKTKRDRDQDWWL